MPDNGRHQTSDHFLLHLKDAQESTGMQCSTREEGVKHFRWLAFPLQSQCGADSKRINKKSENSQRPAWWKQQPGRNFGPSTCWQNDSVPQSPHFAENLKKEETMRFGHTHSLISLFMCLPLEQASFWYSSIYNAICFVVHKYHTFSLACASDI